MLLKNFFCFYRYYFWKKAGIIALFLDITDVYLRFCFNAMILRLFYKFVCFR